ncbi:MAG: hypothetical protein H6732_17845 [Alphaproteobacteria bacterium]|nr:hypothetical protein [Alphaproteobacteria bacterium]
MRLALPLLLGACVSPNGPASVGWAPTVRTQGPTVVYDLDARPLPEIPLPNDAATRLDPTSPTGRRLNVSLQATTDHEREVRARFDAMDGFGAFAPLSVRFDAPLDVADLLARHADDDFQDDAILLLNIDRDCARYGEEIALELDRGRYPVSQYGHAKATPDGQAPDGQVIEPFGSTFFPFDAHALATNLVFEERWEDRNRNDLLDPGEDLDHDGVLDQPNFLDLGRCQRQGATPLERDQCVIHHLLTSYERETNTLELWPLWPLEERCTHAVLLTNRLVGEDGEAVNSPFPGINPRDQTQALRAAEPLLERYDLGLEDVRFAWTFTVGTQTSDLMALREGLYGSGPFAALGDEFPVSGLHLWTRDALRALWDFEPLGGEDGARTWLPGACVGDALTSLWDTTLAGGEWDANMCAIEADLSSTALWFGGTFAAPDLLVDSDGAATERYPHDHDESFDLDPATGEVRHGRTDVTFFCALPYEDPDADCSPGNPEGMPFCKPFPTVIYAHGYGSARAEFTLHMGRHTAMGNAACAVDSYGHGTTRYLEDPLVGAALRTQKGRLDALGVAELAPMLVVGRDRDLTNDGLSDGGLDQWTANIFHTRDMVRQSVLEVMQLVRLLRHMDGTTRDAAGRLLGDVDDDGVVDLGGPHNRLGHWGISLGGILSGVLAGAEPSLDAVSPNAAGAGLTQITRRSTQAGVPEAVVLPMLSQMIVGCLPTDTHQRPVLEGGRGVDCFQGRGLAPDAVGGELRLALVAHELLRTTVHEAGTIPGVRVGDTVVFENLANGARHEGFVTERGWVRLAVASDALDAVERRVALGWGDEPGPFEVRDTPAIGDPLRVVVSRNGQEVGRLERLQHDVSYVGTTYLAGSPMVALLDGFGYVRNTPDLRRLLGLAQHAISPGDPGTWAQHYFLDPIDVSAYDPFDDGRSPRVLVMPTAGDSTVPTHTGIALARAAGLLGDWRRDPARWGATFGWRQLFARDGRYGMSVDDMLVATSVVEGDARLQRWTVAPPGQESAAYFSPEVIFDVDDVSDGTARFSCGPSDWSALLGENGCPPAFVSGEGEPESFLDIPQADPGKALRRDHLRGDGTYDALRIPVLRPRGQHGIYNAQPFRVFDADAYMVDFTARFLATGGADVSHEPGCDCSASGVGAFTLDGVPRSPSGAPEACTRQSPFPVNDQDPTYTLKVCSPACAAAWGLRTPAEAACVTD